MLEKYVIGAQLIGYEQDVSIKSVEVIKNRHGWFSCDNFKKSALNNFLQRYKGKEVAMVLPSGMIFVRLINVPNVPSISEKRLKQIIRYEAQQQIPFPIEEVFWDYVIQKEDAKKELNVRMAAIKRDWVMEKGLENIIKNTKLKILGEAGLPLYNSIEQANGDFFGVINIDEEENFNTQFYNKGNAIFSRSIPIEEDEFTNNCIAELQREYGFIKANNSELPQLHQIFVSGDIIKKDECKKIIEEIRKGIDINISVLPAYSGRADYAVPIGAAITYLNNEEQINFLSHKESIKWDVVGKNALLALPRGVGYALKGMGVYANKLGNSLIDLGREKHSG